jgi:hypothetical protein
MEGTRMAFSRLGGLAAIGFAVLLLGTNLVLVPAGLPTFGAETGEVSDFFTTNTTLVGVTSALTPLVWIAAVLFGAAALRVLWPAERAQGAAWSLVGFAGLLLQNATFTGLIATRLALTTTAQDGTAAATLWALQEALLTLNGTYLATAMVGLSVAGLRTRLIRPWHAMLGLLAAALQFGGAVVVPPVIDDPGPLGFLGLTGWLLWVVWIAGYGVVLIRRGDHFSPVQRQPQPAPATT